MREFIATFLNLVHLPLQSPQELPVVLERTPGLRNHLILLTFLTALSTAVGNYYLRDYYEGTFLAVILLLKGSHVAVIALWSILGGAAGDARVHLRKPRVSGKAWSMTAVLFLSALPNLFYAVAAVPARLFREPDWIMTPVSVLLFLWSCIIAIQGLSYLYEIRLRSAIFLYLQVAAMVLVFPLVAIFYLTFSALGAFL